MFRRRTVIYLLAVLFILPQLTGCGPAKDIEERRNYMIPKKSDLPANSRYKEAGKRKTNNYKRRASKQKSYF